MLIRGMRNALDYDKIAPLNVLVSQFVAALTANLSQLNAQRRRAVQLRVDGHSLTKVREETGLSVPTIIAAFKAFTEGGWHAVDVGARGRRQGTGRSLTQAQEAELALLALYGPPEAAGLTAALWSADAVAECAKQRFGVELHPRAVARCLARWGLTLVALRDAAERSPAGRAWLAAPPRSAGAARTRRVHRAVDHRVGVVPAPGLRRALGALADPLDQPAERTRKDIHDRCSPAPPPPEHPRPLSAVAATRPHQPRSLPATTVAAHVSPPRPRRAHRGRSRGSRRVVDRDSRAGA